MPPYMHVYYMKGDAFGRLHGKKKSIKFYRTSPIVEDTTGSLLKAKIFLVLHYIELFYEMCYKVL